MFYFKQRPFFSFILFFPALFVFSFFFFSCAHLTSSKISDSPLKSHSKNQDREKNFNSLETGLNLFKEGRLDEARGWLERLNYKEKDFLSSILEIQKINYIEKDWIRFFGLASYYRRRLLYSRRAAVKNFKQEMLALEILALIRHCRFPEASRTIKWSLRLAKKLNKDSSKIRKTIYFFRLKNYMGEKKAQTIDWERQIHLWSITPEQIDQLSNPKHVRTKVENKC